MQQPAITTDMATRDRPVFPGKTLRICADRPALLRARDGLLADVMQLGALEARAAEATRAQVA